MQGYSGFDFYDGSYLARERNVIVVTFNYRLGALGFMKYGEELHGLYGYLVSHGAFLSQYHIDQ